MRGTIDRILCMAGVVCFSAMRGQADNYADAAAAVARGIAAYQAEDHATFLSELTRANVLRSDHPTYRYYLAIAQALAADAEASARSLSELAAWGISVAAEQQAEFDAVRNDPQVLAAFASLRQNQEPQGRVASVLNQRAEGRLFEGLAMDSETHQLYLSDLHHACILRVDATGRSEVFASSPSQGFGCGGLSIDVRRKLLWVASPAMPEVVGFEDELFGQSQLLSFNLEDGSLVQRISLPVDAGTTHTVVDLFVAPDGTVYAPDSASPVIWRVPPSSDSAEVFATIDHPGNRHSLQGAALSPDGEWLLVSDYSTGLHRVHLEDRRIEFLSTPTERIGTAIGIDGIAVLKDSLLAVQNGVSPARLLHIRLGADGLPLAASVIAGGLPEIEDPTLTAATPTGFLVIGRAGWSYFGTRAQADPADRMLQVVQVPSPREEVPASVP